MQLAGIFASVALVDRAGRRPLLIAGSFMSAGGMMLLAAADAYHTAALALLSMCIFLLGFSVSYAGVFWVIVSEVFSMTSKSPATAAATAMLFLVGEGPSWRLCLPHLPCHWHTSSSPSIRPCTLGTII